MNRAGFRRPTPEWVEPRCAACPNGPNCHGNPIYFRANGSTKAQLVCFCTDVSNDSHYWRRKHVHQPIEDIRARHGSLGMPHIASTRLAALAKAAEAVREARASIVERLRRR